LVVVVDLKVDVLTPLPAPKVTLLTPVLLEAVVVQKVMDMPHTPAALAAAMQALEAVLAARAAMAPIAHRRVGAAEQADIVVPAGRAAPE
jgi:hypothetical protein